MRYLLREENPQNTTKRLLVKCGSMLKVIIALACLESRCGYIPLL